MPHTNVIFILTDDQGPWAAGCYGNPEIRTPNLDRLAATGVRMENYFLAQPRHAAHRPDSVAARRA